MDRRSGPACRSRAHFPGSSLPEQRIVSRGDIYDVDWPEVGVHPAVVVTRQAAIPVLSNITVALVTSTIRGIPTEVPVGELHGLDHESVVNCDSIVTVAKRQLIRYRGRLGSGELARLDDALRIALELD